MGMERRGCIDRLYWMVNHQWEEPLNKARPFGISKRVVWEAYKRVKANQGAAGVDGESIAEFERDLSNNLYKLWNRMSSGSYFPPPVRTVEIPKAMAGNGRWESPRYPTVWPRWWSRYAWNPCWSLTFIRIPTGTGLAGRRFRQWCGPAEMLAH